MEQPTNGATGLGSPLAIVIGDVQSHLMRNVRRAVTAELPTFVIRHVPSVADCGQVDVSHDPRLVIVCQQTPDDVAAADVEHILGRWPFSRWIVATSAWCQSAGRSRPIWPAAVRVPEANFRTRLLREVGVITGMSIPVPLTGSSDEVVLFEAGEATFTGRVARQTSVATQQAWVNSPDPALRDLLKAICTESGWSVSVSAGRHDPSAKPDVRAALIVEDVDPIDGQTRLRLARLRGDNPSRRVIAMTSRADLPTDATLTSAGADFVIPKLGCYPLLRELTQGVCSTN